MKTNSTTHCLQWTYIKQNSIKIDSLNFIIYLNTIKKTQIPNIYLYNNAIKTRLTPQINEKNKNHSILIKISICNKDTIMTDTRIRAKQP